MRCTITAYLRLCFSHMENRFSHDAAYNEYLSFGGSDHAIKNEQHLGRVH